MIAEKTTDVSQWWSGNPQTYGDQHGKPQYHDASIDFGSAQFFQRVDETLCEWNGPLHGASPFDRLFPFERYRGKRVLEIGCGMGSMASFWAKQGAEVTAIDLAPFSVAMTKRRFEVMNLSGKIMQADGRTLPFADGQFDYVYSWGVLHHSPNLGQSLAEMMRVLRPGGEFGLMLYHRHSLFYLWRIAYREGLVHGESGFLDPVALTSRYTDASEAEGNPHTWPVTRSELRNLIGPYAANLRFRVLGTEIDDVFNMMLPALGRIMPRWMLKPWARRLGWSLWASGMRY